MQGSAGTEQGTEAGQVAACKALFAQLPWEEVTELDADSIREGVRLPLLQHLTTVAGQASQGSSDAADLVHSIMTVKAFLSSQSVLLKQLVYNTSMASVLICNACSAAASMFAEEHIQGLGTDMRIIMGASLLG